jgi:hypothetical protein
MRIDKPWGDSRAARVDRLVSALGIAVALAAHGGDPTRFNDDGIRIENGLAKRPRQHQPDVSNDDFSGAFRL